MITVMITAMITSSEDHGARHFVGVTLLGVKDVSRSGLVVQRRLASGFSIFLRRSTVLSRLRSLPPRALEMSKASNI